MDQFDYDDLADDVLAAIGSEAMKEQDDCEPHCLSELRSATEVDFRYDIVGDIETGGMKSVYRAIDQRTCREVALAFIKAEGLTEKATRYFIQEAWVTARLEHPNIVPIYDVGISPTGSPYFAMKLLSGQTLSLIIENLRHAAPDYLEKFTRRHLLEIFIKICDAISYAHTLDVIHLDLKPDNIQVSDFGQVLVLDWGIASVLHQHEDNDELDAEPLDEIEHTLFGSVKGTPGYIAPELQSGHFAPDYRADIYGLGAILFSLLTYSKAKDDVCMDDPALENVPAALCSVIIKAMQSDPALRYDSVIDLQVDVEAYLAGHATQAEDAGFIRQQLLLIKRNQRIFTTVALSLFILITVITIGVVRLNISQKRALESEKRALAQEAVAHQMLKKYELERGERERREKTSYTYYISRASIAFDQCRQDDALHEVEQAIQMDSEKDDAYKIKMDILISQQKFQQITEDQRYQELPQFTYQLRLQLVQKYATVKDDSRMLTDEELYEYLEDLLRYRIERRERLMKNIFYTINKGKSFSTQEQLLKEAAALFFSRSLIKYDEWKDRVTIKTDSGNILTLISGLRLKQLDLSDSKIKNVRPIITLTDLEYLNLKNSKIATPHSFEALTKLKYLNFENTFITHYKIREKAETLTYLNIARSFISNYPNDKVTVITLNAVEAFQASLMEIASYPNHPQVILLTPAQLKKHKRLSTICEKRGIELRLYDSADDVREEEFFDDL